MTSIMAMAVATRVTVMFMILSMVVLMITGMTITEIIIVGALLGGGGGGETGTEP